MPWPAAAVALCIDAGWLSHWWENAPLAPCLHVFLEDSPRLDRGWTFITISQGCLSWARQWSPLRHAESGRGPTLGIQRLCLSKHYLGVSEHRLWSYFVIRFSLLYVIKKRNHWGHLRKLDLGILGPGVLLCHDSILSHTPRWVFTRGGDQTGRLEFCGNFSSAIGYQRSCCTRHADLLLTV